MQIAYQNTHDKANQLMTDNDSASAQPKNIDVHDIYELSDQDSSDSTGRPGLSEKLDGSSPPLADGRNSSHLSLQGQLNRNRPVSSDGSPFINTNFKKRKFDVLPPSSSSGAVIDLTSDDESEQTPVNQNHSENSAISKSPKKSPKKLMNHITSRGALAFADISDEDDSSDGEDDILIVDVKDSEASPQNTSVAGLQRLKTNPFEQRLNSLATNNLKACPFPSQFSTSSSRQSIPQAALNALQRPNPIVKQQPNLQWETSRLDLDKKRFEQVKREKEKEHHERQSQRQEQIQLQQRLLHQRAAQQVQAAQASASINNPQILIQQVQQQQQMQQQQLQQQKLQHQHQQHRLQQQQQLQQANAVAQSRARDQIRKLEGLEVKINQNIRSYLEYIEKTTTEKIHFTKLASKSVGKISAKLMSDYTLKIDKLQKRIAHHQSRRIQLEAHLKSIHATKQERQKELARLTGQPFRPNAYLESIAAQQLQQLQHQRGTAAPHNSLPPTNFHSAPSSMNELFGEPVFNPIEQVNDFSYDGPMYTDGDEADYVKNLLENIPREDEFLEEVLEPNPEELKEGIVLMKHQRMGLTWLKACESKVTQQGGILADDMGLGKTIQSLSLMLTNRSKDSDCKTNLVIAPVSLLRQWGSEVDQKVKKDVRFTYYIYHQQNKVKSFNDLKNYDLVLISYSTLASEFKKHFATALADMKATKNQGLPEIGGETYKSPFYTSDAKFYRIILDEAQNIKNKLTVASRACATLEGTYRWCLSGTPIQNRLEELYPLLRFLRTKPYCVEEKFKRQILDNIKHNRGKYLQKKSYTKLQALLSVLLLRRVKTDEIDGKPILSLPDKHIIEEHVVMSETELKFYKELESNAAIQAEKVMSTRGAYSSILTLLLRLRQACDHNYLVKIGDDKDRKVKSNSYRKSFDAIKDYTDSVHDRIEDLREDEGFVCQSCDEQLPESKVILLSRCGHVLCTDCVETYFDDNIEAEMNGDRSAKCSECGEPNLEDASVDLELYDAVIRDELSWKQIKVKFDLDSSNNKNAVKMAKIKELIRLDGGQIMVSAKIEKTIQIVKDIFNTKPGEKIIIFSQFTTMFDILQVILYAEKIEFLRYDGSMNAEEKDRRVTTFREDPSKKVLLLSLKAGNVGLTLNWANHVIILEPFWNPYVEKQAQDRVYRIGQTRQVFIHRILIENTVEDRILQLQKEKEELVDAALDPAGRKNVGRLSRVQLGFLFGLNGLEGLENHQDR